VLQNSRSELTDGVILMSVFAEQGARAPSVGGDLRAARERIGYSLEEMAEFLRIRLPYLRALEDGRVRDLPGSAYAFGFLRTYAEALGLDAEEICRRFKSEADAVQEKPELDFPAPVPHAGVPAGAMVLLGLVLTIGAYIGWYHLSGEGKLPAEAVAPLPARLEPLAQQARQGVSPTVVVPAGSTVSAGSAQNAAGNVMAVRPVGLPMIAPGQAAAAIPLPPPAPSAVSLMAPNSGGAVDAHATAAASGEANRIVVRAAAEVWIQLREKTGRVLVNRVLKPGDTYAVPDRPDLLFTTGNALGTELLVDGVETPGLGGVKGVRRDLALDPDMIKDGRLAAQMAGGARSTVTQAQ